MKQVWQQRMRKGSGGFTLVEMMVVIVLMAFLMLGVVGLFVTLLKGQGKAGQLARVKQEGDVSMVAMEQILRDGFDVDCGVPEAPVDVFAYQTDNTIVASRLELVEGRVVLHQCAGIDTKVACEEGTVRYLTSDQVTASEWMVQCHDRERFNHDMVMIAFRLDQEAVVVPFRIITTLRNVESSR